MPAHWLKVEMPSGLQLSMQGKLFSLLPLEKNPLFSEGTMNADTHSASEESVKVTQGHVALGRAYPARTFDVLNNWQPSNKLRQAREFWR